MIKESVHQKDTTILSMYLLKETFKTPEVGRIKWRDK